MPEQINKTVKEIISEAYEAEVAGNFENAVGGYEEAIRQDALSEYAYNRLMLLFRKQKQYKKELSVITQGIKAFGDFYKSKIPNKSKTITTLSNKLNKSFGFTDKKGNNIYDPEPIAKWKKRKLVVEKRINKK